MLSRQELINNLILILKDDRDYDMRPYLRKAGADPDEYEALIKEAEKIYHKQKAKKLKIIWAALAVITFIVFYFLIPISIYNSSPIFISFTGGILLTFFTIQAVVNYSIWDWFSNEVKPKITWQERFAPLLILPGIIMMVVFGVHFSSRETAALKENGVKVNGTIIDGYSRSSRKSNSYEVQVEFKTLEGQKIIIKEDVGQEEFSHFYVGKDIALVYWKEDPEIVELLTSKESIKEFLGIEEKRLKPEDLIKLLSTDPRVVGDTLKKYSSDWKYNEDMNIWANLSQMIIIKFQNGSLDYMSTGDEFLSFPTLFSELGFRMLDEQPTLNKKMESDTYVVNIERSVRKGELTTHVTLSKK